MTKAQKRRMYNKLLSRIVHKNRNLTLQEWLDEASKINIEVSAALEGIYCGLEGRVHEEIEDGLFLTMGWYSVVDVSRVEYAYVS